MIVVLRSRINRFAVTTLSFGNLPGASVLLLIFFGCFSAGRGQNWQKIWVTDRGEGFAGNLLQPSIVIDANQALHVLFAESNGLDSGGEPATFNVTFRYADNVVNTSGDFSPSVPLAVTPATLYSSLALDSASGLHVAFTSISGSPRSCLRYTSNLSSEWKSDAPITCDSTQTFPALCIDRSGGVHVVYEGGESIYYQHLAPNGLWSDPVDLSRNPGQDRTPTIAVAPDGSIHVLFYRWNSTTRRTLMYTTAPSTNAQFSTPQSLRIMSGTSDGLDLPYTSPPFVPSITTDERGTCHAVFTSVFGTNADQGQILYINNAGGTWSDPIAISGIGFYNRASIAFSADGDLHVAAERKDAANGDWDIVYIERVGNTWQTEQDLTANDVNDFAPANGGRFIQARNNGLAIVYQTFEHNPNSTSTEVGEEIAVLTQRLSPQPALDIAPNEIDFGTIKPGECRDSTIVIRNVGAGELASTSLPTLQDGSVHFDLLNPSPFSLLPNKADTIHFRFCPEDTGCFEEHLVVTTSVGERIIRLYGCAQIDTTRRLLRLDTIFGHVGDRLLLTARLTPTPTAETAIDSFRVDLTFDPRALFFHRIGDGDGVTIERNGKGEISIVRHPGSVIIDSILFRIEVEGLVTGQPENVVAIAKASLGGTSILPDTAGGLVYLEGCDIGSGVAFGKGARIRSIAPFPITNQSSITWQAPTGSAPTIRIVDLVGNVLRNERLPEGTGKEQNISLKTEQLMPGWYIIELIDRAEHHSIPILITE